MADNIAIINQLLQNIRTNVETIQQLMGVASDTQDIQIEQPNDTEIKICANAMAKSVDAEELGPIPDITDPKWPEASQEFLIIRPQDIDKKKHRAVQIEGTIGVNPMGLDILDFGCGDGTVAGQLSKSANLCVGYDIKKDFIVDGTPNLHLTTQQQDITKYCKSFDLILLIDVLDHVVGSSALELLSYLAMLLKPGGRLFMRVHPWTSRTGGHLYEQKNLAFLHLALTPDELLKFNLVCPPNIKTNKPLATYEDLLNKAGFKTETKKVHTVPVEPYFSDDILDRIIKINWAGKIDRDRAIRIMSTNSIDYLCYRD